MNIDRSSGNIPASLRSPKSIPHRLRIVCQLAFVLIALCLARVSDASDTPSYGALLDKHFASGGKSVTNAPLASPNSNKTADAAALERALMAHAKKITEEPPPPPEPQVNGALALTITSFVAALLMLKLIFALNKVRLQQKAAAEAAEAEKLKRIGQEPTVVTLFSELQHGLNPPAVEAVPEAQTAVCSTEEQKAEEAAFADDAVQLFEIAPLLFSQLQERFSEISHTADVGAKLRMLHEFSQEIRPSKTATRIPALRSHRLLALALEGLLKQLSSRAQNLTSWRMRLATETLELMEDLCVPNLTPDLATNPPIRLLVVDDCAINRRSMVFALKKIFRQPDLAESGEPALALATKNAYDAIFLDIEMPGMDGFELCEKIRKTELNRNTPIVFVTSHDNFESRAKLITKGAQDLIGKPYLPTEITLKALQLSLCGRLKNSSAEVPAGEMPAESPAVPQLPALSEAPGAA
jgi:CheY-like chemotaxis protein/peroxiredoxin